MLAFEVAGLCGAVAATPAPAWMSGAELSAAFGEKTIEGYYPGGRRFDESYDGAGRLLYHEEGRTDAGAWSVHGTVFCTIYDARSSGGCFQVVRVSRNCFEFYFNAADVADIDENLVDPGPWVARAWVRGTASTCEEPPSV